MRSANCRFRSLTSTSIARPQAFDLPYLLFYHIFPNLSSGCAQKYRQHRNADPKQQSEQKPDRARNTQAAAFLFPYRAFPQDAIRFEEHFALGSPRLPHFPSHHEKSLFEIAALSRLQDHHLPLRAFDCLHDLPRFPLGFSPSIARNRHRQTPYGVFFPTGT